jgi:SAM-dependent MidA family methyltransferase
MAALTQKIKERILREGPITFETFMEMALYYPDIGYYTSKDTEIGKKGDFYTSPHLHPIFGAMLGRQIEEMWGKMGKPADFRIVEIGGGKGYLCKDMLDYLKNREIFRHLSYILVELNPYLMEKQKSMLSEYAGKIDWVSSIKELKNIRGVILSNELLDSMPVHVIQMQEEPKEVYVTVKEDEITETLGQLSTPDILEYLKEFSINLSEGYRTEINLRLKEWLEEISDVLTEGFVITIDYGYPAWDFYSEERTRGTLLCYYKHEFNEKPYENIGKQDITSHVNFSALKKWGEELGLKSIGFCRQGIFLVSLGIDEVITELYGDSPDYGFEVAKIKGLIMPGTIGETHKIMVQYKGKGSPELRGFAIKNQLKILS